MSEFLQNQSIQIQGRLPESNCASGRTYVNQLPDYIKENFKKAMFASKGKANNPICLELSINGVPEKTIAQVAQILDENKYYYDRNSDGSFSRRPQYGSRVMGNSEKRGVKKVPGLRKLGYDRVFKNKETLLGRTLKEIFGDDIEAPGTDISWGVLGWYNNGQTVNGTGVSLKAREKAIPALYFTKYDEAKRQEILKNKITKGMVMTRNYQNYIPRELQDKGVTEKVFVQQQTTKYFDELYAMTQSEKDIPEIENPSSDCRYQTLSEVGYNNSKIKDAQMVALIETVYMSLDGLGIGLYHEPKGYRGDVGRGYKRLLQKINSAYKQFGTLMRKGFDAETARSTVVEQLEFWISEWRNTDQHWIVFKRKDWVKPETTKKKASTTGAKKSVATAAEALAILQGKEEKKDDGDI